MELKKGKRNSNEWEYMIVHKNEVCMGVHFKNGELKSKEKLIIAKHLQIAAQEIDSARDNHAK